MSAWWWFRFDDMRDGGGCLGVTISDRFPSTKRRDAGRQDDSGIFMRLWSIGGEASDFFSIVMLFVRPLTALIYLTILVYLELLTELIYFLS